MTVRTQDAAKNTSRYDTEMRSIASLTPHPGNTIFSDNTEGSEIQALAEDIRQNGLQHPIDILPDGTILGGHRRVKASEALGEEKIACRVILELEEQGELAQEQYLLRDNLVRRQLKPAEQARCLSRLLELSLKDVEQQQFNPGKTLIKNALANKLSISPRTLSRSLQLAECPRAVQDACDAGQISHKIAIQFAGLPEDRKLAVEQRLRKGGSVRETLRQELAAEKKTRSTSGEVPSAPLDAPLSIEDLGAMMTHLTGLLTLRELSQADRVFLTPLANALYRAATGRTLSRSTQKLGETSPGRRMESQANRSPLSAARKTHASTS